MLKRVAEGANNEDMHALSDVKGSVYKRFQVKQNLKAFISGSIAILPDLRKNGKFYTYLDNKFMLKDTKVAGVKASTQLPADFLINEEGIIVDVYRSKSLLDFMEFERIEAFIPESRRCKCNKQDCISSICRENYHQIRKEAEAMLYVG